MRSYLLAVPFLIAGCGEGLNEALMKVMIPKEDVVVVASAPLKISGSPTVFNLRNELKIESKNFSVCLALKDGVPPSSIQVMSKEFSDYLRGAKIAMEVSLLNGRHEPLTTASEAWSKTGRLLKGNELSACASVREGSALSVGDTIKGVSISSDKEINVPGVYVLR